MKTLFVLTTMVLLTSSLLAGDSKDYPNVAEWKTKDTGYHTGDMVKYKSNIFRAAYWAGKEPGNDPGWSLYDELYDETSHSATQATKVIGYLPTWRKDLDYGNAVMYQNITHGIIAFLQFDEKNLGELDDKSAKAVTAIVQQVVTTAHKSGTYISVAIGGATDYGFLNLLTAVGSNGSDARLDKAVQNVAKFVKDNALDGVDLDLECWWDPNGNAGNDQGGRAKSKGAHPAGSALVLFAQKLKAAMPDKLLSATLFATSWYGNNYDPKLADQVDWLSIMSYDLTGSWNQSPVGPHTALLKIRKQDQYAAEQQGAWPNTAKGPTANSTPMEDNPIFSVEDSLWYWSNPFFVNWQGPGQKVARNKLVAGVPLYGYDFAYKKDKDPESGQTPPGYKVLRYKELVQQFPGASTAANANIKVSGNTPRPGFVSGSGSYPYAHNIYLETPDTAVAKLNFLKKLGLQGVIIWEMSNEVWDDGKSIVKALYRASGNPTTRPALPAPSFKNAPSGDRPQSLAGAVKNAPSGDRVQSHVDAIKNAPSGDQAQSLADAIKNNQNLGNARTSALNVLLFVSAAEGNVDATKFIKDNKVDDGADHDDAKVFRDAAYAFSQLNGGVPNGSSEQNVLDRFRTALDWDLGNHTSAPNVASEWDSYLFAENQKGQGYHSVGLQLNFEQAGEQATKNLDNGVERTATQYHYVGRSQPKGHVPNPRVHEGDGDNTAELWLEQPGDMPPDTVNQDGVQYTLEKGSDGKPVSRQQKVRDVGALNQAIAKAFGTALQNHKPQYDKSGNLQNADPITRLAQYTAQTQFHPQSTHAVESNDPNTLDHFGRPGIAPHAPPKQPTETTGPTLTHDNPGKSDRDAMQALLNVFGVTSGNYQDILKAAQSNNPDLGQESTAAQVVQGFVPGGSLLGALVQYGVNKELLDWKKQQTQKQGRGTYYIDLQESQNQVQLLTSGVQSIFDIATSIIGPPDGLVADVLRGLKNVGQKLKQAGSDFAKGAEHDIPKAPAAEPPKPPEGEPNPESDAQTCLSGGTTELSVAQKGLGNFAGVKNFAAVKKCGPPKGGGNKPKPKKEPGINIGDKNQVLKTDDDLQNALSDGLEVPTSVDRPWSFPKLEEGTGDGKVGGTCVSKMHERPVSAPEGIKPEDIFTTKVKDPVDGNEKFMATDELAVHTTFSLSIAVPSKAAIGKFAKGVAKAKPKIEVTVKNVHFTCRPKKVQLQISQDAAGAASQDAADAAVSGTTDLSSHRGINDWLHNTDDNKLKNLAGALGIKTDPWDEGAKAAAKKAIDDVLKPYDKQALKAFQDQLTQKFETELTKKLSDSDKANVEVIVNFKPEIK